MKTQTVFTCDECGKRIEYDSELECYLEHKHGSKANYQIT